MTFIRGEELNVGIGIEDPSNRGDLVEPQVWIGGRTPTGINVELIKTLLKETKASGMMSRGSEIVRRSASGDLEFNVRSESLGYLLKSLMGKVTSTVVSGSIMSHKFEILASNPEYPSMSIYLSQPGQQDYGYNGSVSKNISFSHPTDDLVNAVVSMIALDEAEVVDKTVAFSASDYTFRPYEVEIKIADDIAGLAAADPIDVKDYNLNLENNSQGNQPLGTIVSKTNLAGLAEVGGSIVIDYENDTYHDLFKAGTYKAFQIKYTRADVDLGGGVNPSVTIQMARVSFEASNPNRPLDDIIQDSFDFLAHYDEVEGEGVTITLVNEIADYNYDVVS